MCINIAPQINQPPTSNRNATLLHTPALNVKPPIVSAATTQRASILYGHNHIYNSHILTFYSKHIVCWLYAEALTICCTVPYLYMHAWKHVQSFRKRKPILMSPPLHVCSAAAATGWLCAMRCVTSTTATTTNSPTRYTAASTHRPTNRYLSVHLCTNTEKSSACPHQPMLLGTLFRLYHAWLSGYGVVPSSRTHQISIPRNKHQHNRISVHPDRRSIPLKPYETINKVLKSNKSN